MLEQLDLDHVYTNYGFPNDMLVHLNVWNARVRDFPSRPIYGVGERSNMRYRHVVPRIASAPAVATTSAPRRKGAPSADRSDAIDGGRRMAGVGQD